jgi:uncharacterized membrane protein SpoIIM required for sporulation
LAAQSATFFSKEVLVEFLTKRLRIILVLFLLELLALVIVPNTPFIPGEEQFYAQTAKQLSTTLQALSAFGQVKVIFENNLQAGLILIIPVFGTISFGYAIYSSSRLMEAQALTLGIPSSTMVLNVLATPSTWIELSAYAVAAANGLYLLYGIVMTLQRRDAQVIIGELRQLAVTIALIFILLIVAAVFEVVVTQVGAMARLAMWLPLLGLVALSLSVRRHMLSRIKQP